MTQTIIVVPVYNEALRLNLAAFRLFLEQNAGFSFLFVDDGSQDQTAAMIQKFQSEHPCGDRLSLLQMPCNQGKAEAVRAGMTHAMGRGAQYMGYWDADLATPLAALPRFLEVFKKQQGVTLVMGARVKLLGRHIKRYPWRHYLGRVFATFASLTLGLAVYDTQCGAKVFKITEETRLVFEKKYQSRWIFDVEMLARFCKSHAALLSGSNANVSDCIYELVLDQWEDKAGSKVNLKAYVRSVYDLAYVFFQYRLHK